MAFTYDTKLQNAIAQAVWNMPNSGLTAAQKVKLDGTWTSGALTEGVAYHSQTECGQLAQYFEQAAAAPDTSFAQPAWNRLFIAKAAMYLVKTERPERFPDFQRDHEVAYDEAIDTYTRTLISTTSLAGQGIDLAGIRSFVIDHCVKRADAATGLRRRLFPSTAQIDGHIQWVLNFIWNCKPWHFRKRQVTFKVAVVSVSTATWTENTKTLTETGAFTNTNIGAGSRFLLTDGTGATVGEYVVSSRTSDNAIVLDTSISAAAANLSTGDITGSVQVTTLAGMHSGETFDSIVSRKFYYGNSDAGSELCWVDASDMARCKAWNTTGMPCKFRWEKYGSGVTWHLSPFPDGDYSLTGAVSVSGPGALTTSVSLDTAIARFPSEFSTVIRDMVLARTLLAHRASDGDLMFKRAMDQCDTLLPAYADQGFPNRQAAVIEDVYDDYRVMM